MGFYLELSCEEASCDFRSTIGNATEFYVNADGVELPYGHPVCMSAEAAKAGIAGYWRDLVCWECGRRERESIKLGKPIHEPTLAWSMFKPPDLKHHPRLCTACEGILCDTGMVQMFLHYRADPAVFRGDLEKHLRELQERRNSKDKEDDGFDEFDEYFEELIEREGDPGERMEAELRDLATIGTDEEFILYRLGLVPRLPVAEESLAPLKEKYIATCQAIDTLRTDMFAKMDAPASEKSPARGPLDWFHSPVMKAKRALDAKIEELKVLKTHAWVAKRLLRDERGTLDLFRNRCPKCRAEPLGVQTFQT